MTLTRTPVPPTRRGYMSKSRAARILAAGGHKCAICGCDLTLGTRYEIDHTASLFLGGSDDDDNCRPACVPCHRSKSKRDARAAAKLRRQIAMAEPRKPSRIASRGFGGAPVFRVGG